MLLARFQLAHHLALGPNQHFENINPGIPVFVGNCKGASLGYGDQSQFEPAKRA
jgi:hypothetical protein